MPDAKRSSPRGEPDAPESPPLVIQMPVDVSNLAITVIAVLGVMLVLQSMQSVLIPIVLGLLISYALSPIVKSLTQHPHPARARRVPCPFAPCRRRSVSASGRSATTRWRSCGIFRRRRRRVAAMMRAERNRPIRQRARASAGSRQGDRQGGRRQHSGRRRRACKQVEIVDPGFRATDYLWMGGQSLIGFGGQFAVILFLVYFLLVTDDLYKRKLVKIAGPDADQEEDHRPDPRRDQPADRELHQGPGADQPASSAPRRRALWAFGVDHFVIWGLLAGIFNSIPYLGPIFVSGGARRRRVHAVRRPVARPRRRRRPPWRSPASKASCSRRP